MNVRVGHDVPGKSGPFRVRLQRLGGCQPDRHGLDKPWFRASGSDPGKTPGTAIIVRSLWVHLGTDVSDSISPRGVRLPFRLGVVVVVLSRPMRVLGIDPGTRHCGFGVVEVRSGSRLVHIAHGVISPRPSDPLELRLGAIFDGLSEVVRDHAPTACSVEEVFFAANVKSALTLGHARGVALLVAARAGLAVNAYPPAVIKQAVVGTGRAEKSQVARMVSVILGLPPIERSDASDALAIAITHATRGGVPTLLSPRP